MQEMYAKFNDWREKYQKNVVDLGGRLGASKVAFPEPGPDGPLVEVKELVGGYMIVSAESLDEAIQVAHECSGLMRPGSGVEVWHTGNVRDSGGGGPDATNSARASLLARSAKRTKQKRLFSVPTAGAAHRTARPA